MKIQRTIGLITCNLMLLLLTSAIFAEPNQVYESDLKAVKAIVQQLSDNLTESELYVKVGPLTLTSEKISGPFADRFLAMMEIELHNYQEDFVKISRELVTKEVIQRRSMPPTRGGHRIVTESGATLTEVILKSEYKLINQKKEILISSWLEKGDGTEISRSQVKLKRSAFKDTQVIPDNAAVIKDQVQKMDDAGKARKDFKISLWINKGNGGVYRENESLKAYFRSESDCYLRVVFIDVEGRRILMYPSEFDSKGKLAAGIVHELHENNQYTISPPFGSEMIVAVASTAPVGDQQNDNILSQTGYRGLGINVNANAKVSETRVFLTTYP